MDERYIKEEHALIHLIEEASELIKVLCKIQRFGIGDHHPKDSEERTNLLKLIEEKKDVDKAFINYINSLDPEEECKLKTYWVPEE